MIFVFLDDNTLEVHDNGANLSSAYETIDIENGEYTFFDEDCNLLCPQVTKSPKMGVFFGLIPVIREDNFKLTRGINKRDEIFSRLATLSLVNKNKRFKTTSEVLKFLEDRRKDG